MHQSTNHAQCFDNERSTTSHKTIHYNAGKGHGKKGKTPIPPLDRSPPELTPAHEQGKKFVGKKQRNRRQRRVEAREKRRLQARALGAETPSRGVDAGTQTTPTLAPTPAVTSPSETNRSSNIATTQLPSSCHPPIDYHSSTRDKDDVDDNSAAAMAIPISDPNDDFVRIVSLNELLQWLKLEATSKEAQLPPFQANNAFTCMRADAHRGPQSQDYRKAQMARQPTLNDLQRKLKAGAGSSRSASNESQDDVHTREIQAREAAKEKAAAKKAEATSNNSSRKVGNAKGKKSIRSKSAPSTPPQTPKKKTPSRTNSFENGTSSIVSSPVPARRNAISEASTTDPTSVMASTTPFPDSSPRNEPDSNSPGPFADVRRTPTWVRDVTAPLPSSPSPTTCMISHSGFPDLKFRGIQVNPWGHTKSAPKNNPFHDLELLKEERCRNVVRRRKERKEMKKAFRALQKEKALGHEKALFERKAVGDAASLKDGAPSQSSC